MPGFYIIIFSVLLLLIYVSFRLNDVHLLAFVSTVLIIQIGFCAFAFSYSNVYSGVRY